jgi:DNA-binding beta-propeller fold protein YncE
MYARPRRRGEAFAIRCRPLGLALGLAAGAFTASCKSTVAGDQVNLAGASPGIGFDDLRYSSALHRVLVPAGRSGRLDLIDPERLAVTEIGGFSATPDFSGGHDDGPTSVDEGGGFLFVTDRTSRKIDVVDPRTNAILGAVSLGAEPDYVRFVPSTRELWVTEPGNSQIEIFSMPDTMPPVPTVASSIPVVNGPESLVIDAKRGRAYTYRWQSTTVVLDVTTRAVVEEWPNGCASSRGIALDEARGFLFAACLEGTTSVLDVDHGGHVLSSVAQGSGFDVMGYNPALGHVYLAGSACECLVTLGVSAAGKLSFLARQDAPSDTHCVTADDVGHAWVCDPKHGSLVRVTDSFASTL